MCKIPVHTRHPIKVNKFKSRVCYYMPNTLLYMNYGEYKNILNEMAYNLKELPRALNFVVKMVKAVIGKEKNPCLLVL